MTEQDASTRIVLDRVTWSRVGRAIMAFMRSKSGRKAQAMAGVLLALVVAINGLNVATSYVGRDFMTAIAQRNMPAFLQRGAIYVGMFVFSAFAATLLRFTEERLGLVWRDWMTQQMLASYLEHPIYHRLSDRVLANGEVANPDQRISEDVRVFTVTALSFLLLLLNAGMTAIAFSGVMWSISPSLFAIAVVYALAGSYGAMRLGHRLIGLQSEQLDKEASFRSELVHVREHSESIALLRHEPLFRRRLAARLAMLIRNFRRITVVNRNLNFFTTGYNYLIQVIPALIIAPSFIRGEVEFGVITQSTVAFTQLLGAFSLIVTQFQSISSFSAVVARLDALHQGLDQARAEPATARAVQAERTVQPDAQAAGTATPDAAESLAITLREEEGRLGFERLTLRTARDSGVLLQALSLLVEPGTRVRILGENAAAKHALFRATAGVWDVGEGEVIEPGAGGIMFLPEQPYMPPGTLRQLLAPPAAAVERNGAVLEEALRAVQLDALLERVGGLDCEQDWGSVLSLAEQQLVAVARVLIAAPRFVFLDRPGGSLPEDVLDRVFALLSERGISYLVIGDGDSPRGRYDATLELREGGAWAWTPAAA